MAIRKDTGEHWLSPNFASAHGLHGPGSALWAGAGRGRHECQGHDDCDHEHERNEQEFAYPEVDTDRLNRR